MLEDEREMYGPRKGWGEGGKEDGHDMWIYGNTREFCSSVQYLLMTNSIYCLWPSDLTFKNFS